MARSFAELIQMSLTRANRLGFCYVEYRGQREDGRFVNTEAVSLKFWLWIALILAGGWYTLGRTKEDMVVRYHKESLFDIGTYFVSNMIIVLLVLHMSWHGYFCRDVQLKLLNDVLDIERKLVMVFKRRCEYGNIERYLKIFTIWSIFFYVVLLNVLFVIDYWNYDDFIAMYVVALILLYSNFCMDLTIIVCCTVQMSLCLFLESLMDVLGSNSDEFAGLYTCVKQIDRIAVLVNYNMSRIYGPFVVLHCSYVLFDSASMWVSLLEATLNTNFDYVRQETHWMLANYLLWLANDVKNVILMAISSSLLHNKVEETALCTRHFDDYRLQNTRAAKQIQKFLLKNLHQKKKFSACGFFDIDNTVIYMVFSSIVTYLVILIQFKQLETDLTQSEGVFNVTSNLTTPGPS
uniref:Gustatory receptor n=1 Tax=Anopheles dirus TaxID=7168 RepID=A0A182NBX3_9DIPT